MGLEHRGLVCTRGSPQHTPLHQNHKKHRAVQRASKAVFEERAEGEAYRKNWLWEMDLEWGILSAGNLNYDFLGLPGIHEKPALLGVFFLSLSEACSQ